MPIRPSLHDAAPSMAGTGSMASTTSAYLCETNIYVDTGGVLTDITPVGCMIAPVLPGVGGQQRRPLS